MRRSALIGLAAIPFLTSAAPPPSNGESPADAFVRFCLPSDPDTTAAAILHQADAAGWRHTDGKVADTDERTASGSDGSMNLRVDDISSAGETRESCGLTLHRPDPALIGALQTNLGFAPAFHVAGSATFFALRTPHGWRDGKGIDAEAFTTAKKAGNFFSLMVMNAEAGEPTLAAIHVLPGGS
jgi:hypothetical protein